MNIFALTGILSGAEIIALTLITQYSKEQKLKFIIPSIIIYGIMIPLLVVKTLNFDGIGTVNFLWNIITTVAMIIIGHYLFNETITHMHFFSFLLGVSSIVLLLLAENHK